MIFQPTIINQNISEDWIRRSDWLPITKPTAKCEFKILNAVYDGQDNYGQFNLTIVASLATTYVVDWGDGSNTVYPIVSGSNTLTCIHQYSYSAISDSTISTKGYKQVVIHGSIANENALTSISSIFTAKNNLITTNKTQFFSNFLEVYFGYYFNQIILNTDGYGTTKPQIHYNIEYVYVDCLNKMNVNWMCQSLKKLQKMDLVNTSTLGGIYQCFVGTTSLKKLKIILKETAYTDASYAFASSGIEELELITSKGLLLVQTFNETHFLKKLKLTIYSFNFSFLNSTSSVEDIEFDMINGGTGDGRFSECYNLRRLRINNMGVGIPTINVTQTQLCRDAILNLFADLYNRTATTAGTITITNALGANLITANDLLIATNKNWTVIP